MGSLTGSIGAAAGSMNRGGGGMKMPALGGLAPGQNQLPAGAGGGMPTTMSTTPGAPQGGAPVGSAPGHWNTGIKGAGLGGAAMGGFWKNLQGFGGFGRNALAKWQQKMQEQNQPGRPQRGDFEPWQQFQKKLKDWETAGKPAAGLPLPAGGGTGESVDVGPGPAGGFGGWGQLSPQWNQRLGLPQGGAQPNGMPQPGAGAQPLPGLGSGAMGGPLTGAGAMGKLMQNPRLARYLGGQVPQVGMGSAWTAPPPTNQG